MTVPGDKNITMLLPYWVKTIPGLSHLYTNGKKSMAAVKKQKWCNKKDARRVRLKIADICLPAGSRYKPGKSNNLLFELANYPAPFLLFLVSFFFLFF